MAVVGLVALSHHPSPAPGSPADPRTGCEKAGAGDFCAAVAGLSKALRSPVLPLPRPDILPPPTTPGAIDARVTQANIDRTICVPGYARSARPAYSVTGPLKRRMMDAVHPGEPMANYELDHLIPISIGGAPLDPRDLWLQARRGQANAGDKNVLAYVIWRLVCKHRVPLETAQQAISHDWTRAYAIYATPANVAEYHFRHGE
ncbi:hypothetical protein [Sphingomonas bacterium]|uniref:hypothetical protein n=1 Tax=Sphingomonas bacterium TaxID=1895847 RepID=UPI0020C6016D|nr:hypothetical protein [Sphingomonas bacterium]